MIPIYRAKTIKQDYNDWEKCDELIKIDGVWYAIGFYDYSREVKTYLGGWETNHLILIRKSTSISEISTAEVIDPTTLAIHFPEDMIDSKGNKLFASLLNDVKNDKSTGTGGSIIKWNTILTGEECIDVLVFYRNRVTLMNQPNVSVFHYYKSEEIGVQQ